MEGEEWDQYPRNPVDHSSYLYTGPTVLKSLNKAGMNWDREAPKLHQAYIATFTIQGMDYCSCFYKDHTLYQFAVAIYKVIRRDPSVSDVEVP